MNKQEISEIKRRFKKEDCSFTRMCGCYVDGNRSRIVEFGQTFLNLEDEEFYKYLEIAKKTLSGTLGNNLLELEFPLKEEENGGKQQFLLGLRESVLKNDELLNRFYDLVIENYSYTGNYLILLFHDAYDVMKKTTDHQQLDESEEVYEYLLCAICPVTLSKPGLGYLENDNRIGVRIRDWVVGAPETGFLFPSFTDRSTDIHSVLCYFKNAKAPHSEFVEGALGCKAKRTAAEQKLIFEELVKTAFGEDADTSLEAFYEIQQELSEMASLQEEPIPLSSQTMHEILSETKVSESAAAKIEQSYEENFSEEEPMLTHLIDDKAVEEAEKHQQKKELVQKVEILEQQLEDTRLLTGLPAESDAPTGDIKTYDVILRVKPEKAAQITSEIVHGQKCLVIPMGEGEHAIINGVNTLV